MLQAVNEWIANEWLGEESTYGGRFSLYTSRRALPMFVDFGKRTLKLIAE